jgi:hypothetical protein
MTRALGYHRALIASEIQARFGEHHFRALKSASRRGMAVASVPLWVQAGWGALPDLIAFWALLLQGACLVLTLAFAALERRWGARAAGFEGAPSPAVVHTRASSWDDVRAALWSGLALVCLVPGIYVATGRPFPKPLLSASMAAAVAVFVLVVVAETVPRLGAMGSKR